jgi:hypothetical protein
MSQEKQNRQKSFLVLFLLVAAGICGLLALPNPTTKADLSSTGNQLPSAYSPEVEKLVNQHMFFTSQKQDWAEKKMQAENSYSAPAVGSSILQNRSRQKILGVDHTPDRNEDNAFMDLNRYPKEINLTNPEGVIQGQLQDQERQQNYERAYRQEFARQFIENARQHGYRVQLNDDLVVVSVTPISPSTLQVPVREPSGHHAR